MYGISEDIGVKCSNVNLLHYETTPTLQGVIESFNITTNEFALRYIYKRLKFFRSKTISHCLTLLFLAIWHGFSLAYYNTFALEFLVMKFETDVSFQKAIHNI